MEYDRGDSFPFDFQLNGIVLELNFSFLSELKEYDRTDSFLSF